MKEINTVQDLFNMIEEKNKIESKLKEIWGELKDTANNLDFDTLDSYDYEPVRDLLNQIDFQLDADKRKKLSDIVENKKIKKYPQLLKPTYYPEIDTLNISDEEKLRLDKAAYYNERFVMSENNIDRLDYKLSIDDLELLVSIGIVERKYQFRCADCDDSCLIISESDLEKYRRAFQLNHSCGDLTDEQDEELDKLFDEGFFCITVCCTECDFYYEISTQEELDNYEACMKTYYEVVKNPDLTYEKI